MRKYNSLYFVLGLVLILPLVLCRCSGDTTESTSAIDSMKVQGVPDDTCLNAPIAEDDIERMAAWLDPAEKKLFVLKEYTDAALQFLGAVDAGNGAYTLDVAVDDSTNVTYNFAVQPVESRVDIAYHMLTDYDSVEVAETAPAIPKVIVIIGILLRDSSDCCKVRDYRQIDCHRVDDSSSLAQKITELEVWKCKKVNYPSFCRSFRRTVRVVRIYNTLDDCILGNRPRRIRLQEDIVCR